MKYGTYIFALQIYFNHDENKYRMSQLFLETLGWLDKGRLVRTQTESCLALVESLCPDLERREGGQQLLQGFCLVFHQMLPGISTKLMKLIKDRQVGVARYN